MNYRVGNTARKALLIALVVLAVLMVRQTRRDGEGHFLSSRTYEDIYYLPPPQWLGLFSLGHREAAAGMIWLKALIYFGDELVHRGDVSNLYAYTDAMLTLDPYFKKVYHWSSTSALYRPGHLGPDDAWQAIGYLERGVRLFPDDGRMAWELGATYLYELIPLLVDPEEKAEARRKGIEHLRVATLRGAGPAWLALTAASELGKLGHREQQIAHLQEVYSQVDDPRTKERIEDQLARLRSEAFADALRATHEQLESERLESFPYLDMDLFVLVGSKPAFDGQALLLRNFDPEEIRFQVEGSEAGQGPTVTPMEAASSSDAGVAAGAGTP